ncbi:hypothetical protein HPT27_14935 [Permianibacter sp. IMCC34836]|uniref:hypothetical protein n=1 Tax=Permianibacter fluminis TaxID=2738515 RepID=UPI0015542AFD|nr:hypothetical protein [Permianibacter fluminis]NQD38321.1 hypothetical protein [Permianibacter fluminis]
MSAEIVAAARFFSETSKISDKATAAQWQQPSSSNQAKQEIPAPMRINALTNSIWEKTTRGMRQRAGKSIASLTTDGAHQDRFIEDQ